MLLSTASRRNAYANKHPPALRTNTSWDSVLEHVQHSGYLNVPGVAACALARCCRNANACHGVLDSCNNDIGDALWNTAFTNTFPLG